MLLFISSTKYAIIFYASNIRTRHSRTSESAKLTSNSLPVSRPFTARQRTPSHKRTAAGQEMQRA